LTHCRHLCAGLIACLTPVVRIADASPLFGQRVAGFLRHDTTEARVILTELSVIGVVRPDVAPPSKLRPFRPLRSGVGATVEGVIFSESTDAFPARRSKPGCLAHFGRPFNPHRT